MKIIITDLELTQPEESIIQIGAVAVDISHPELKFMSEFNRTCWSPVPVSSYITDLTGITQEQVDQSSTLRVNLKDFWDWVGEQQCGKNFGAWGRDEEMLKIESRKCKIEPPKTYSFNIKTITNLILRAKFGSKMRGGLKNSLRQLGIEYNYKQHDALEDAKATAVVFHHVYQMQKKIWQIRDMF